MIQHFHDDNLNFMKNLSDKSIDLALEDPPYGIGESSKNRKSRNKPAKQKNGKLGYIPENNYPDKQWDNEPPSYKYFSELFRVSINQIIFGANYFTEIVGTPFTPPRRKDFQKFMDEHPVGWILWDKVNSGDFHDCELAWTSFDRPSYIIRFMWNGMMQGKSIREGHIQQGNKKLNEKRIHPCQKPVALYKNLLERYATNPYMVISDFNSGSNSQSIAAYILGFRNMYAVEKDPDIYLAGIKRYTEYTSRNLLF